MAYITLDNQTARFLKVQYVKDEMRHETEFYYVDRNLQK